MANPAATNEWEIRRVLVPSRARAPSVFIYVDDVGPLDRQKSMGTCETGGRGRSSMQTVHDAEKPTDPTRADAASFSSRYTELQTAVRFRTCFSARTGDAATDVT